MGTATLRSDNLLVERLPNGKRKVLRDLTITSGNRTITVPAGFVTDYSSIPLPILIIVLTAIASVLDSGYLLFLTLLCIPRFSRVDLAGVVHDWLYESGGIERYRADQIWANIAMSGQSRANFVQASICFIALRVGGIYPWLAYRTGSRVKNDIDSLMNKKDGSKTIY